MMEVLNARLVSGSRGVSGGVYIDYVSKDNVIKGSYVEVTYEGKTHYFEAKDIATEGENLKVTACEVGYYAHKFDEMPNLDIRSIIGLAVSRVDDPSAISKIREASCWC